jgi:predicted enzyme related to lactoylglutathione lyase
MANHPIVHIELSANTPKEASKFYADVFDWKIQVDNTFDYHMFQAEGGPGGGFVKTGENDTKIGDVLVYIGTDDIEGTLAKIESHGGKTLVPKTEIPGMGWFAIFHDPTGNRMALFTDHQH